MIKQLVEQQQVVIKVIGDGEKKDQFLKCLSDAGAEVIDYGRTFEYKKKKEIIDTCHYGINIMKKTIDVGLSMKSIDYLEMGLPIINNLDGDLSGIIRKYECGINTFETNFISQILSGDIIKMRRNARRAYESEFGEDVFRQKLGAVISDLH